MKIELAGALLAASLTLSAQTIDLSSDPNALYASNSRKIVSGRGSLHTVFMKSGRIHYSSSLNGLTWSIPIPISPAGSHSPGIAVAADGTLGVIGNGPSGIQYTYCKLASPAPCTTWSSTAIVASNGATPAVTAYGNEIHIVWTSFSWLSYTHIPANFAGPTPPYEDLHCMCSNEDHLLPTIHVTKLPSSATPEVRVTYFTRSQKGTVSIPHWRLESAVKGTGNWNLNDVLESGYFGYQFSPASLSTAVNITSGEIFVAASFQTQPDLNGAYNAQTKLYHRNLYATSQWQSGSISSTLSEIGVDVDNYLCTSQFRIAVSDQFSGHYGSTWYRTGTWPGSVPQWSHPLVTVSTIGHEPTPSFWIRNSGSFFNGSDRILVLWADTKGAFDSVLVQQVHSSGIPISSCYSVPVQTLPPSTM